MKRNILLFIVFSFLFYISNCKTEIDSKIKRVNHCNGPEGPSPTRMDNATVAVNLIIIFPSPFRNCRWCCCQCCGRFPYSRLCIFTIANIIVDDEIVLFNRTNNEYISSNVSRHQDTHQATRFHDVCTNLV